MKRFHSFPSEDLFAEPDLENACPIRAQRMLLGVSDRLALSARVLTAMPCGLALLPCCVRGRRVYPWMRYPSVSRGNPHSRFVGLYFGGFWDSLRFPRATFATVPCCCGSMALRTDQLGLWERPDERDAERYMERSCVLFFRSFLQADSSQCHAVAVNQRSVALWLHRPSVWERLDE